MVYRAPEGGRAMSDDEKEIECIKTRLTLLEDNKEAVGKGLQLHLDKLSELEKEFNLWKTEDYVEKENSERIEKLEKRIKDIEPNNANHILYEQWVDKLTDYVNRIEKLEQNDTILTKDMFEWVQYFVKSGLCEQIMDKISELEKKLDGDSNWNPTLGDGIPSDARFPATDGKDGEKEPTEYGLSEKGLEAIEKIHLEWLKKKGLIGVEKADLEKWRNELKNKYSKANVIKEIEKYLEDTDES